MTSAPRICADTPVPGVLATLVSIVSREGNFPQAVEPVAPPRQGPPPNGDTHELLTAARHHRLFGLLARAAPSMAGAPGLPGDLDSFRDNVSRGALAQQTRTEVLLASLDAILKACGEADVTALCFKGPVLSTYLYGAPWVRCSDDLDLLVPPPEMASTARALRRIGYVPSPPLPDSALNVFAARGGELVCTHATSGLRVDVSSHVLPFLHGIRLDPALVFASPVEVTCAGIRARLPANPVNLVLLAVHGAQHRWSRLAWLADFAQLMGMMTSGEAERAVAVALNTRTARILATAVRLAAQVFGTTPPRPLADHADGDPAAAILTAEAITAWHRPSQPTPWESISFVARSREHLADRLALPFRLLLEPGVRDYMTCGFPESRAFLYPVARPVLLAARFACALCRQTKRARAGGPLS